MLLEGRGDGAAAVQAVLRTGGGVETQGGCGAARSVLRLDGDGVTDRGRVVGIHWVWSFGPFFWGGGGV